MLLTEKGRAEVRGLPDRSYGSTAPSDCNAPASRTVPRDRLPCQALRAWSAFRREPVASATPRSPQARGETRNHLGMSAPPGSDFFRGADILVCRFAAL